MNTSASIVDTIALSLLHFLWQGAAIAAVAGALMLVLRKPATRYLIGVGALALMLLSFGTTVALLSGDAAGGFLTARAPAAALASPKVATVTSLSMLWTSQAATSSDVFVWMARAWFAGVFVFALRIVIGLLAIERLRRGLVALSPRLVTRFETLQARLGIDRVIRYCQCDGVSVPAVIGVFRPIVLLPMRALTGLSAEQLDAVVAHELGHIQRFDVAVNFLQVIAETLLFFHPAVWWLNKRIRAEREDCCDDIAVAASGSRVTYARALAAMEGWRETPDFAMAATGGTVAARVARLLGVSRGDRSERVTRAITAMLVLTTAIAAGAISMGVAQPAFAQASDPSAPLVAAEPAVPSLEAVPPIPPVPAIDALPPTPAVPAVAAAPAPSPRVAPPAPPLPVAPIPDPPREAKEPKPAKEPKVAKEPKAAKVPKAAKEPKAPRESNVSREPQVDREPRIDREVRIETRQIDRAELRLQAHLDTRENVDVHVNTQQNQKQNANAGIDLHDPGVLVLLKNGDVTQDYVRDILATGLHAQLNDVIALRSQDVSPAYVAQVRALGIGGNAREIIAMKSQDVSPAFLQSLMAAGVKFDAHYVIAARAMGITSQDIERPIKLGLKDLNVHTLIQLKSAYAL